MARAATDNIVSAKTGLVSRDWCAYDHDYTFKYSLPFLIHDIIYAMIQISEMALAFTKQLQGQLCERKYSSMKSNVADNNRK